VLLPGGHVRALPCARALPRPRSALTASDRRVAVRARTRCRSCPRLTQPAAAAAAPAWRAQFFTALSVFALVLVCTSVFMTQKPPWMEGKEADLGISSPFIGPDPSSQPYNYNNPQMHDMGAPEEDEDEDEDEDKGRPQALAQVKGRPLSGKAAVRAAAAHPGGLLHGDDAYVRVGTGQVLTPQQRAKAARGDELREAQQLRALAAARGRVRSPPVHYKGNDAEVPVTQIKAETYPLMNLASQDSNGVPSPPTANKLLAKAIRESGAGNGNYIDTTEGTVTGPAPITQVGVCLPCLLFLPRL
jgi:hypothetical protein